MVERMELKSDLPHNFLRILEMFYQYQLYLIFLRFKLFLFLLRLLSLLCLWSVVSCSCGGLYFNMFFGFHGCPAFILLFFVLLMLLRALFA